MEDKHFRNHYDSGLHKWEKKGKVKSKAIGGVNYTEYQCANCGLKAKMYKADKHDKILTFTAHFNRKIVEACSYPVKYNPPKRIRITYCKGIGTHFKTVRPGTRHRVVTPPSHYLNDYRGVWIQGYGTLVKVYSHEFEAIEKKDFSRRRKGRLTRKSYV